MTNTAGFTQPRRALLSGLVGDPYYKRGSVAVNPGSTVTIFTDTVPVDTTRKLSVLWVTAINDGEFSLKADGIEIASGRIDHVSRNIPFNFYPDLPIDPEVELELTFTADSEPTVPFNVTAFLSGYDIT